MQYLSHELIARTKQLPDFKTALNGEIPSDFWIIGIRNPEDTPNKFDDRFYLMKGEELVIDCSGTTNPGTPVLKGGFLKYNKDGAAVVESDRIYPRVWKFGLHQGKIRALLQVRNITIRRDGDGDDKSEEIGKRTSGLYGINFHSDEYDIRKDDRSDDAEIGWWSAGCQVSNQMEEYNVIINSVEHQTSGVTYVLLNEFSI